MKQHSSNSGLPNFFVDQLAEIVFGIENASSFRWQVTEMPAWAAQSYHHLCYCQVEAQKIDIDFDTLPSVLTSVRMQTRIFPHSGKDIAMWIGQCPICQTYYIASSEPDTVVDNSEPQVLTAEYKINDYALVHHFSRPGWRESIIHQLYQNMYKTLIPLIYGLTQPIWVQFFPVTTREDKGEFGQFSQGHTLTLKVTIENVTEESKEDPLGNLHNSYDKLG